MDLIFYLPTWLADIIFITGYFSIAIILLNIKNIFLSYIKHKRYPLHPIEEKYFLLLDENKQLKTKIVQYETQQEQILEQMIEQLKEK